MEDIIQYILVGTNWKLVIKIVIVFVILFTGFRILRKFWR